jgi:AraC-like DNA-binding protein
MAPGARVANTLITQEFHEFRHAVSSAYVPLRVTSDAPNRFRGSIRALDLDQLHVSEVTARTHLVERTPELISRGGHQYFKLSLQLSGTGLLAQSGREALLLPGDIAIYDTDRPYTLVFDDDFRMLVLMFPQTLLDLPADSVRQLAAVRFEGCTGIASIIEPFLRRMADGMDALAGPAGPRLGRNALDLVATMFAAELGAPRPHAALASRIRAYIDEHLGEPGLGPAQIAAAHYISTRHLHGIFHKQGESVSALIRARRLERSRRDLLNPLLRDQMIGGIATRWGFVDAAHFSRLYKTAFGESPSDTRAQLG